MIIESMARSRPKSGFTLIELLVVIGIIAVLIGILIPVVSRARESSRRTQCASQLRQIGLGLQKYFNDYGALPARTDGLDFNNPHVFHYQNDPGNVADVMLKYCGPKPLFYCPEGWMQRDAGAWWPYSTGTIAVTYQFPFWLNPNAWIIVYPNYRRLTSDRLLAADILAADPNGVHVEQSNHRMTKAGWPVGMNELFGDGHVEWKDGSNRWVQYGSYGGAVTWHFAQF
jgi:prepilin-type N-terminal cleavage/methylation domain-containing protein